MQCCQRHNPSREGAKWPAWSSENRPTPPRTPAAARGHHKRSLGAEVRAIFERAAQAAPGPSDAAERFPDWFIRMTQPGIDFNAAIEENRLQIINPWQDST